MPRGRVVWKLTQKGYEEGIRLKIHLMRFLLAELMDVVNDLEEYLKPKKEVKE